MALPVGSRRVSTVITVSVVLVAGSAAALVNSQVLRRSTDDLTTAVPISLGEGPTTSDVFETVPTTVFVTPSTLSPSQSAFQADAAGQVVIDTDGGTLAIVSVDPSAGYQVESMSQGLDPNNVSVLFRGPDGLLYEFHAGLLGGEVAAAISLVEETSTSTPSGGTSGSTSTSTPSSTATTIDDDEPDDPDDPDEPDDPDDPDDPDEPDDDEPDEPDDDD